MPAYSPAHILRDTHLLPFYKLDWYRGVTLNGKVDWPRWKWPPRYFNDVTQLQRLMHEPLISMDVENGGDGHPMIDPLLCIGLGTTDYSVTVRYPFRNRAIENLTRQILVNSSRKVLQNMNHDRLSLKGRDIPFFGPFEDTLPAGCVIASKAHHDLGSMHNWYYFADRYKTKFHAGDDRKGAKAFANGPYSELADYNGKDCIATAQTFVAQMGDPWNELTFSNPLQ